MAADGSVNAALLDWSLRHATYIERFKASEWRKLLPLIEAAQDEVVGRLRRGDLTALSRLRLQETLGELRSIYAAMVVRFERQMAFDLYAVAELEARLAAEAIETAAPLDLRLTAVSPATLSALVSSSPIDGLALDQHVRLLLDGMDTRTSAAIRRGVLAGLSNEQIVRQLTGTRANGYRGVFNGGRVAARRLVHTAVQHVSSQAREQVYIENDDVVAGVQWVATLDDRTCPVCGALDGKVFDVGKGRRPPAHIWCRCTAVPYLHAAKYIDPEASTATRASMNGQVPASERYDTWFARQSADFREDTLGPSRFALYEKGGLDIRDFVTTDGRELTLKEIAAKYPKEWGRAGLLREDA